MRQYVTRRAEKCIDENSSNAPQPDLSAGDLDF
jgi:hypothetical protein